MQNTTLPPPPTFIYFHHLEKIGNEKFTKREAEVMACIFSNRSESIASLLNVSQKTIDVHVGNSKRKIKCNSRDGIIDFIEKSGKGVFYKQLYFSLQCEKIFTQSLKKMALHPQGKNISCIIYSWTSDEKIHSLLMAIKKHLKLSGVPTLLRLVIPSLSHEIFIEEIESLDGDIIIYPRAEQLDLKDHACHNLDKIGCSQGDQTFFRIFDNIYFFSRLEGIPTHYKAFQESISDKLGEDYYLGFFKLLSVLRPEEDYKATIAEFKERSQYILENTKNLRNEATSLSYLAQPQRGILRNLNRFQAICVSVISFAMVVIFISWRAYETSAGQDSNKIENISSSSFIRSGSHVIEEGTLLHRPRLLAEIDAKFIDYSGIQTVALIGIGGAGKTTLASQYARSQKSEIVWEINAENRTSALDSFERLALAASRTSQEKTELKAIQSISNLKERERKLFAFIKSLFKQKSGWFLIFDNLESFEDIKEFFPNDELIWGTGKVLITSRNLNLQNNTYISPENIVIIQGLKKEEILTLFLNIIRGKREKHLNLIEEERICSFLNELPPFPLDVSIAAFYIKNYGITYEEYGKRLRLITKSFDDVLENTLKEKGDGYTRTRYGIISLTINQIIEKNEDFRDLLLLSFLLDSQNIPQEVLQLLKQDLILEQFIHELKKHSLLTNFSGKNESSIPTFSLHRSTQENGLAYLSVILNLSKNNTQLLSIAAALEEYLANIIEKEDLVRMHLLTSHCERFLLHEKLLPTGSIGPITGELGCIYFQLSNYSRAKILLNESIPLLDNLHSHHLRMAQVLSHLGSIYRETGNYPKAKDCLEKSIAIYKQHHPNNHVGVTQAFTYLGCVYRELGDFTTAKDYLEKSLDIYNHYLPDSHAGTARALTYLGSVYRELGDYSNARKSLEQTLSIYEKYIVDNHIGKARVLAQLGSTYRELGQYKKAELLLQQSLQIYDNHPGKYVGVPWTMVQLSNVYRELGIYDQAKTLLEQSLMIYAKEFSDDYFDIAWASAYLGNLYNDLGLYEKAKATLEQSLTTYKKHHCDHHVRAAWASICLGRAYRELKEYQLAKRILEDLLTSQKNHYGADHIEIARVLRELGKVYYYEFHIEQAESLLSRALEIFQKADHPEVYTLLEDFAEISLAKLLQAKNEKDVKRSKIHKEQCIGFLNQALKIVNARFPDDSPHIRRIQLKLQNLYNI